MQSGFTLDLETALSKQKVGPFQILVVVLCACALLADGFDTMAIGYVAPALVRAWHINRSAMTPVFAMGQIATAIGALCFGPIADRFGRRPVIIGCSLMFGVLSLLAARATSIPELMVYRFFTCLGLGGAMPNALALTNEYIPARIRTVTTTVMFCGFSVGAALGGVAAASLIEHHGWEAVFVIGGTIPLIFTIVFMLWLPESISYLAITKKQPDRLARYAARIGLSGSVPVASVTFAVHEKEVKGSLVRELFANGRGKLTLLLWVIAFTNLLDLNLLSSWLPTMLRDAGLAIEDASWITVGYQIGGLVGTVLLGLAFERFPPFRVLLFNYLIAFLCIVGVGISGAHVTLLYPVVFLAGFCVIGGLCGSSALVANCYPTGIRATGLGWALGIGRIGAVVGPTIGGFVLEQNASGISFFTVGALPILCAAAAAWTIYAASSRRSLLLPVVQKE
jgi:AAHS family 4-hydroxybenzoate transporter-like MFS transporter